MTEDARLLEFAGMMGHEVIGIAGEPGQRRKVCEVNMLDEARRLCDQPTLTVYARKGNLKKKKWLSVYDRRSEVMVAAVAEHNAQKLKEPLP